MGRDCEAVRFFLLIGSLSWSARHARRRTLPCWARCQTKRGRSWTDQAGRRYGPAGCGWASRRPGIDPLNEGRAGARAGGREGTGTMPIPPRSVTRAGGRALLTVW